MLMSDRRPSPEIAEYVNLEDIDIVRNIVRVEITTGRETFVSQDVTFSSSLKCKATCGQSCVEGHMMFDPFGPFSWLSLTLAGCPLAWPRHLVVAQSLLLPYTTASTNHRLYPMSWHPKLTKDDFSGCLSTCLSSARTVRTQSSWSSTDRRRHRRRKTTPEILPPFSSASLKIEPTMEKDARLRSSIRGWKKDQGTYSRHFFFLIYEWTQ